jgi:hypothetical protein
VEEHSYPSSVGAVVHLHYLPFLEMVGAVAVDLRYPSFLEMVGEVAVDLRHPSFLEMVEEVVVVHHLRSSLKVLLV